ncbi:FAD-binding oxidoreductase [Nitratidesulfovibrio sp. SRB-5]|uniref:FAD-binding oxidoreductase n=1 Tax=Nitratidesulfovibrio sp. SRB-5 TaxID=2872636 RepID=UPI001027518A|nr:FAD-linked oxidase C-terminal domain-containing protein [Nitratidesulfovibrio sp. SRB-5]MBZ2172276.1 FAD-binding protein [Nitratidesulfovibrio sp. SRB-5]RXF77236.1 FAD-binding protein [Desulfovibrio sp. DS-1]
MSHTSDRSLPPTSDSAPRFVLTDAHRAAIVAAVGESAVLHSPGEPYDRDASELRAAPDMVVLPETVEQVQALLRCASAHAIPVIPRGGGTGLAGGCLAVRGGVVLSLERMNRIRSIDPRNLVAEVEAGVISQRVRDAAAEQGLYYPPDPAGMDRSTIGGNVATNAGGPACVKYGVTRDYVLGVEAVLPDGELLRAGVRTRKGVVGYDMAHLLCGSEGTLGVITALTLKLVPLPPATVSMAVAFPDMAAAMRGVAAVLGGGHLPSAIEFLDHRCIRLLGELLPIPVPGDKPSLLIIELDGAREQIVPELDLVAAICRRQGATHVLPAADEETRARVWGARRQVSLRIHDYAALYMSEDVAVPLGAIAELVAALPEFEQRYGMEIFAFGHAGDGNIHLNVTAPTRDTRDVVEQGIVALVGKVLELGGTISGEHGIGEAKKHLLPLELSPASIRLQRGIRQVFDPRGIMNPGKVFGQ